MRHQRCHDLLSEYHNKCTYMYLEIFNLKNVDMYTYLYSYKYIHMFMYIRMYVHTDIDK
jgi:hypothetical protein